MTSWAGSTLRKENYGPEFEMVKPIIMRRDKGKCQLQWAECTIVATAIDHIDNSKPLSHAPGNLQAVCRTCHQQKTQREALAARTVPNPRQGPVSPGVLEIVEDAQDANTEITDKKVARSRDEWIKAVGPMWNRGPDGEYVLPKYTLGWGVLAWVVRYLRINGEPFIPTGQQARFILWAYAVDEEGEWLYDELVKVGPKGLGKDPLLAMIASVEVLGPSRFSHWKVDATGKKTPVGRDNPGAHFGLSALNIKQNEQTFEYLDGIYSDEAIQKYNIVIQKDTIWFYGRTRSIVKLSSSGKTKEGMVWAGISGNELEHWTQNNGMHRFYNMMKKNLTKVRGSRFWGMSNAYDPSEDSIIQRIDESYQDFLNGRISDPYILLDFKQATRFAPYEDLEDRLYMLRELYEEAVSFPSFDIYKIARYFTNSTVPFAETLAGYYNSVAVNASSWIDIREWDKLKVNLGTPNNMPPMGTNIVLAADLSLNDDCSALVGIAWGGPLDGTVFPLGIWKPEGKQRLDREEIDQRVDWAFMYYKVKGFYADPSHKKDDSDVQFWAPYVDRWHQKYSRSIDRKMWASTTNAINFDMASSANNKLFVEALDKTEALILDGGIRQNGDEELRTHFMNATRVKKRGYQDHTIGKPSPQSPDKIDGAVCTVIGVHLWSKLWNIKKPPTTFTPIPS